MPYQYDVFISYKRGKINEQWMEEIFLPFFINELDNALSTEPRVFIDKKGLTPGVDFENELFSKLIYSKAMVSIWSPPYFRKSEWCVKEFLTSRYKQEYFHLNENTMPKTLLWPVMYRLVNPLPAAIQKINFLDYSEYNCIGDAFFKSDKFLKFQTQLQNDIKSLANIIENAPEYDPVWDTEAGKLKVLESLKSYYTSNDDFDKPFQTAIVWAPK